MKAEATELVHHQSIDVGMISSNGYEYLLQNGQAPHHVGTTYCVSHLAEGRHTSLNEH